MKIQYSLMLSIAVVACAILFSSTTVYATQSNESIAAQNNLTAAAGCINDMLTHNITVTRANDSYIQAQQLHTAQNALEARGGHANYALVIQYSNTVCSVRDTAIKASDELVVFLEQYHQSAAKFNLSAMDLTYNAILTSYKEERFEDTLKLINTGYDSLSSIESSQTQLALFYRTTTQSIASFFKAYWKILLFIVTIAVIILLFTWRTLRRFIIHRRMNALRIRRISLNNLIKKTQTDYFKTRKMSEVEFDVKLKTFKEMLRDVDRQVPMYTEELAKLDKTKKVFKSK